MVLSESASLFIRVESENTLSFFLLLFNSSVLLCSCSASAWIYCSRSVSSISSEMLKSDFSIDLFNITNREPKEIIRLYSEVVDDDK